MVTAMSDFGIASSASLRAAPAAAISPANPPPNTTIRFTLASKQERLSPHSPGTGNGDADQIGRSALGAHPDPAGTAAYERFWQDAVVRRHDCSGRDRMRHHRLGRGKG